jgi:LysR family transcriptional regulator (chromosome initiation inhibitor)
MQVDLNPGQLDALVAIADHGSFDAAAQQLHITPSAVSQRIRALEAAAGQVLVSRGTPCRPTSHGEWLVRLGRQTRLLYAEAAQAITAAAAVDLPVAVNADSLTVWFRDVLAEVATWDDAALKLRVEDQGYSQDLLRSGDVLAAVTSDPAAVQGCSVDPLGALRYVPAAAPAVADRWWRGASPDWAAMPVVVFGDKDDLQHELLRRYGADSPAVAHQVPTTADFYAAVRVGLGWAMLPEPQARADLASGALVRLPADVIEVPLYWQRWRLDSPKLAALTGAVRAAAARHLLPGDGKDQRPQWSLARTGASCWLSIPRFAYSGSGARAQYRRGLGRRGRRTAPGRRGPGGGAARPWSSASRGIRSGRAPRRWPGRRPARRLPRSRPRR